jgi:hypothetical protein
MAAGGRSPRRAPPDGPALRAAGRARAGFFRGMGDPNPLLFVDPSRGGVFSVGFGGSFMPGGRGGGPRGRGGGGAGAFDGGFSAGGFGGGFGDDYGDGLPPFRNGALSDSDDDSDYGGGGAGFGRGQAAARERRAQEQAQRRRAVRGPHGCPLGARSRFAHNTLHGQSSCQLSRR